MINPATPLAEALPYLDENLDLLLVMTVVPCFGGQAFMSEMMPKVEKAAAIRAEGGLRYHIEVDGGIDSTTILEASRAGADVFVAGTSVFKHPSGPLIGSQTLVHLLEQERIKN